MIVQQTFCKIVIGLLRLDDGLGADQRVGITSRGGLSRRAKSSEILRRYPGFSISILRPSKIVLADGESL